MTSLSSIHIAASHIVVIESFWAVASSHSAPKSSCSPDPFALTCSCCPLDEDEEDEDDDCASFFSSSSSLMVEEEDDDDDDEESEDEEEDEGEGERGKEER